MNALADLQRELQAHVLQHDAAALNAVVATPQADAAERLGIYSHAYRTRLVGVLREDFPGLRALAGDDGFERLALAYIAAIPSTHANVRWYGADLAAFAQSRAPWSERPELAAMAKLEWALGLAFDAADEVPVDFAAAAALAPADWPLLQLRLHASLQRLELEHNLDLIRLSLDRGESVPSLQPLAPSQTWVAWRWQSTVHHRRLEEDEADALEATAQAATFAQLCERLCQWHAPEEVAMRAATLLRRWIEDGWVARLELAES